MTRRLAETAVERARRLANWLLTKLPDADQAAIVAAAHRVGDVWLGPALVIDDDGATAVTTMEAARLTGVNPGTIRQWACTPHPHDPDRMLLPRWRKRGRERTYLLGDVWEAKRVAEQTPLTRRKPGASQ